VLNSATKEIQGMQVVSNLPISAGQLAAVFPPFKSAVGSQALIGRFETACIP